MSEVMPPTGKAVSLAGDPSDLLGLLLGFMSSMADARNPISELVQNGLEEEAKNIWLEIVRERGGRNKITSIIIKDDGNGFKQSFEQYVKNIGNSIKKKFTEYGEYARQSAYVRGEFAIGMQSFRSIAKILIVINITEDQEILKNHEKEDPDVLKMNQVRMMKFRDKDERNRPDIEARIFESYQIPDNLKALRTNHGVTCILENVSENASRMLDWKHIKSFLSEQKRQYLLNKKTRIWIKDGKVEEEVAAVSFEGDKKQWEQPHPNADIDVSKRGSGSIKAELYFHNPKPGARVMLTVRSEPIYFDIAKLDEFNSKPWNLGAVEGTIEYDRLHKEPSRTGVNRDTSWDDFVSMMKALEVSVNEEVVKRIERTKKLKDDKFMDKLRETFSNVRRETDLLLPGFGEKPLKGSLDSIDVFPKTFTIPTTRSKDIHVFAYDDNGYSLTENDGLEYSWSAQGGLGESIEPVGRVSAFKSGSKRGETSVTVKVKDTKSNTELSDTVGIMVTFPTTPGPLYSVRIQPLITKMGLGTRKQFFVIAEDENGEPVNSHLKTDWIVENEDAGAKVVSQSGEDVIVESGNKVGSFKLKVKVLQGHITKSDFVIISVVQSQVRERHKRNLSLPTFNEETDTTNIERHSRLESDYSVLWVNIANEDYRRVSNDLEKRREYILWLYVKELSLYDFNHKGPAVSSQFGQLAGDLTERMLSVLSSTKRNF